MKVLFFKSKWEMERASLAEFVERVAGDGFDGSELYLAAVSDSPEAVRDLHQEHGLGLIAQVATFGDTPADHARSLGESIPRAAQCRPLFINGQIGRDIFPFEENVRIIEEAIALGEEHGVAVLFETHRSRPTYSALDIGRYLERVPRMRLTADFSHWMVVHESDLRDQDENVAAASARSDHIHARVGHEEGPQVTDPRAPEWRRHLENHLRLWRRIVERKRSQGAERLTITPEFGPPGYMPTLPFTNQPVADAWRVNVEMRKLLIEALGTEGGST
jgi:sugar phosphate isomerase/epimerase